MATRHSCLDLMRQARGCLKTPTGASRNFSSQRRNWPRGIDAATKTTALCSPHLSMPTKATPSILHHQRAFSSTPPSRHGHLDPPKPGEERTITFIDKDSTPHTFTVSDGANLLDIAQAHELEMEGACGGSCACSTCHVIVEDESYYDKMAEPDDDENDMLDLAFGLTETSRLGCQVRMSRELSGVRVRLPRITRNLQESDFK